MRSITRFAVVTAVGIGCLAPMGVASAADAVQRSGTCTGSSSITLRAAEAAGDAANLRLSVNSRLPRQVWNVQLFRQGNQIFAGQRTENAQGDFVVTRSAPEVNGVNDVYSARARNTATGEVCTARVVLPE